MSNPTPEYPWSDLIESEDGRQLTVPKHGLYCITQNISWGPPGTNTEIQRLTWDDMPQPAAPEEEQP